MIIKYCILKHGEVIFEGTQEEVETYWYKNFADIIKHHTDFGVILDTEYTRIQDIPDDVWEVLTKEQKLELDGYFG